MNDLTVLKMIALNEVLTKRTPYGTYNVDSHFYSALKELLTQGHLNKEVHNVIVMEFESYKSYIVALISKSSNVYFKSLDTEQIRNEQRT